MQETRIEDDRSAEVNSLRSKNFSGCKIDRIYRILLSLSRKDVSWYRIAREANVAYGWAHSILSDLRDDNIISGSIVRNPHQLFEKWAGRTTRILFREYHVQQPEKLIKDANLGFALTSYYAEHLVGKYLFPRKFDIYIHQKDAPAWHTLLTNQGYVGKGNLRILLTDEHVFHDGMKVEGLSIVSIQQLIVDLMREGAECSEAADLLIERFYGNRKEDKHEGYY